MPVFYDHIYRKLSLDSPPQRIISLIPSITELLFDFGLDEQIAGLTKYCIHPPDKVIHYPQIGGTDNPDLKQIKKIAPDLILAGKEENPEPVVRELMKNYNVFVCDVKNYMDAINLIQELGDINDCRNRSNTLIQEITGEFSKLKKRLFPKRAVYLIWKNPYMTVSKETFINDMLNYAGLSNVFISKENPYPVVELQEIASFFPDYILLPNEPYPFNEKDKHEFKTICPDSKILLVDGELFSWYGSRMKYAPDYFNHLFNFAKTI